MRTGVLVDKNTVFLDQSFFNQWPHATVKSTHVKTKRPVLQQIVVVQESSSYQVDGSILGTG